MSKRPGRLGRLFGRGGDAPGPSGPAQQDEPAKGWGAVFATRARLERFESEVREYFRAAGVSVGLDEGVVHVRSGPDAGTQLGLMNLAQVCAQDDESRWGQLVREHFDLMDRAQRGEESLKEALGNYDAVAARLVVRLWERAHLPAGDDEFVVAGDLPGLAGVLSIDSPEAIRTVKREEAAAWGRADAELLERALQNVAALAPLEATRFDLPDGGAITLFQCEGEGGYYAATMALRPGVLSAAVGRHGAFVSVPVRHALLVLPLDDAAAIARIEALVAITLGMERDGPGAISRRI